MASSEFMANYRLAEPTIRKLYDSGLRLGILDALKDGPMRLADLRREVNANAPNTSSKAKELEGMGLVERVDGEFQLTRYGRATLEKLCETVEFHFAYEKFKGFWETRNTAAIPEALWTKLGNLKEAELVQSEAPEVMKTHEECLTIIKSPKNEFYGITPLYRPVYLEIAFNLLNSGIHTEFIISEKVLKKVVESSTPKTVRLFDDYSNHVLFLNDKIPLTLKVSECWFFLALDSKSSNVDMMGMDLQSKNPQAIRWGRDLYEFYKSKSKPITLADYL
jgi:predicted transcriptional regulator